MNDQRVPGRYPEVGARFVKGKYVEFRGWKGEMEVIEVVAEQEASWEGEVFVYRYGMIYVPDYERYTPERYTPFPACDLLKKRSRVVIPEDLLSDMDARALEVLFKRVTINTLLTSVAFKWISMEAVEIYFTQRRLPYRLRFTRFPDGSIARTKTENATLARGHLAKGGNTGIPRTLCKIAYQKAVECFEAKKVSTGAPQTELFSLTERADDD